MPCRRSSALAGRGRPRRFAPPPRRRFPGSSKSFHCQQGRPCSLPGRVGVGHAHRARPVAAGDRARLVGEEHAVPDVSTAGNRRERRAAVESPVELVPPVASAGARCGAPVRPAVRPDQDPAHGSRFRVAPAAGRGFSPVLRDAAVRACAPRPNGSPRCRRRGGSLGGREWRRPGGSPRRLVPRRARPWASRSVRPPRSS